MRHAKKRSMTRSMTHSMKRATLALALVALAGCSTGMFGRTAIAPEVRVADLELIEGGLFEQRFRVVLRVLNPNDFDLPLDGLRFALSLNERPFARGSTPHGVVIPRLADATVAVEATTSTFDIVRQLLNADSQEAITYSLDGTAFMGGSPRELPFQQSGKLELMPAEAIRKLVPATPSGQ
jgi:LEA14-like dessication related protein